MITLKEAVKIAERERNGKVVSAGDCGDKWAFGFEVDNGKTDGSPLFVHKLDGRYEYFCPAEFMYSLAEGNLSCTPVDLPKYD